jgi:purine-binding chemotaxis protein CheW
MGAIETLGAPGGAASDNALDMAARALDAARTAAARSGACAEVEVAGALELFGSFLLGGEEFALPASSIREVVNFPAKITAIPLSPAFLEGVFTLRGMVIPVVNLGRLFDAGAPAADGSETIAIIDHEQVQVGILFGSIGEVLRVRPEQRSTLAYRNSDAHAVIAGTILLGDGARLIQVLDAAALIRIENVPQVLALRAAARLQESRRRCQGARRQCVSFRVAGSSFAFEMGAIQEIIRVPELSSSILNSKLCLGRMNFRGSPVAVVDFATLLHPAAPERVETPEQRVVIARIDDATIGFLVDSVDNIVSFFDDDVLPIPLLSKARAGMFGGCISQPGIGDIIYLDHKGIFSQTEIVDMRNGHDNLFRQEAGAQSKTNAQQGAAKARRQVYLTFALDSTFAVEIRQIREIIDFSDAVTTPPGMPSFMRGILNLRQQMISVIDLRCLYAMAPLEDMSTAKILVIERGAERYGLLVDTVANIMTIADSNRFPAPKMMRNQSADGLRGEMEEVIDLGADAAHGKQTLSVFQTDALMRRLAAEWPEFEQLQTA